MSRSDVRPWSQIDDAAEPVPAPGLAPVTASAWRNDVVSVASHWLGRPSAAFVPAGMAAAWGVIGGLFGDAETGATCWSAVGGGLLAAAAIGVLLISLRAQRAAIQQCERVLAAAPSGGLMSDDVADELQPLLAAVQRRESGLSSRAARPEVDDERRRLERRLEDIQRRRCEAMIAAVPEALVLIDSSDQIAQANPAAAVLFGSPEAELLRRPLPGLVASDALWRAVRQCRDALGGTTHRTVEVERDDRVFEVSISTADPAADCVEAGPSHNVLLSWRDVTRDREVSRAKSDFVAKAAHELRTPLSSIKAYVELLVDGEAADEKTRAEYYGIINASGERLGRMIDNMLNISRIEAGTVRVSKEPVSLALVAQEAMDLARPQAEAKKIKLVGDVTPVLYQVLGDRDLLSQAVLNLLSNGVKYTPEGGTVTLKMTATEDDHVVTLAVSDTGVGIPAEDLPRMFEKFFRVQANNKVAKGTGLGLNLVRHIVETVHGGKVNVASRVGEGSTFSITLPLVA